MKERESVVEGETKYRKKERKKKESPGGPGARPAGQNL